MHICTYRYINHANCQSKGLSRPPDLKPQGDEQRLAGLRSCKHPKPTWSRYEHSIPSASGSSAPGSQKYVTSLPSGFFSEVVLSHVLLTSGVQVSLKHGSRETPAQPRNAGSFLPRGFFIDTSCFCSSVPCQRHNGGLRSTWTCKVPDSVYTPYSIYFRMVVYGPLFLVLWRCR